MKRIKKWIVMRMVGLCLAIPKPANADVFGGQRGNADKTHINI